jgi:hypothetical protein
LEKTPGNSSVVPLDHFQTRYLTQCACAQILSAILSRYYCFAHPESILWIFWYVREASTAVLVTNLPNCYTLLRRILNLPGFGTYGTSKRRTDPSNASSGHDLVKISTKRGAKSHDIIASESMENITGKTNQSLEIWQQRQFIVEGSRTPRDVWSAQQKPRIQDGEGQTQSTITAGSSIDDLGDAA